MEKRRAHIAGMSPATILAMAMTLSSVIGGYFVMQDDISDLKESVREQKQDNKDTHRSIWQRINK